jgi:osmoprotectant transport system ATP-binding protein
MSVILSLESIHQAYGEQEIFNNLNLSIQEKTITAILGKSGSGKSTLLQMMNGLVRPDKGAVIVFGKTIDYERIEELRLKIGYAVQGAGLFPHLTVAKNIMLPGIISKQPIAFLQKRLKELLNRVNLPEEIQLKYPYELSGGEQQRVGLCRAVLLNPPLVLLDEAFSALDDETKNEIHEQLLAIQKAEPRTMVLVTHNKQEAEKLADSIFQIEDKTLNKVK